MEKTLELLKAKCLEAGYAQFDILGQILGKKYDAAIVTLCPARLKTDDGNFTAVRVLEECKIKTNDLQEFKDVAGDRLVIRCIFEHPVTEE